MEASQEGRGQGDWWAYAGKGTERGGSMSRRERALVPSKPRTQLGMAAEGRGRWQARRAQTGLRLSAEGPRRQHLQGQRARGKQARRRPDRPSPHCVAVWTQPAPLLRPCMAHSQAPLCPHTPVIPKGLHVLPFAAPCRGPHLGLLLSALIPWLCHLLKNGTATPGRSARQEPDLKALASHDLGALPHRLLCPYGDREWQSSFS